MTRLRTTEGRAQEEFLTWTRPKMDQDPLEMAKWLVAWGRRYDAEWDGVYDILQCLWNLSRSQYMMEWFRLR